MEPKSLKALIESVVTEEIIMIFESFKDAKRIFTQQGGEPNLVKNSIQQFKHLRDQGKIQNASEKDISQWIKKGWSAFLDFVKKHQNKNQGRKLSPKEVLKFMKIPTI